MQRINSKNLVESFSARISADWVRLTIYTGNVITKNRRKWGEKEHPVELPRDVQYSWRRRRDWLTPTLQNRLRRPALFRLFAAVRTLLSGSTLETFLAQK